VGTGGRVAPPMRLGFDVSPLHRPHPRGVVRVVAGLVDALESRGRIEVVRLSPESGLSSPRWRQVELPRIEARLGLDGIHSMLSAFPLRGAGRRVQTIHELPWLHGVTENAGWRHRLWAHIGPRRADRVVTATEATARDVRMYSGIGPERIRVVPWGLDPCFGPSARGADEAVLARFDLRTRAFVMCAGGGRTKKRADTAIAGAVALARRGGARLTVVITGAVEVLVARDGGARFVGEVTDAELAALYRSAAAVLVLARSEGFGLPVLEAGAAGTPVVVARGTAQAEVAGMAGIPVDPDDSESVADGLLRALASNASDAERRRARAAEFTWDRAASLVESMWSEILA